MDQAKKNAIIVAIAFPVGFIGISLFNDSLSMDRVLVGILLGVVMGFVVYFLVKRREK